MNAGRDVERLIRTWLVEESPGRAPDRILSDAARTIDRTRQRRFLAAWREPVSIGLRGFAAMAAVLILAVIGAVWIGRSTASIGTQPAPAPASSQPASTAAAGITVAQYKAARDAVCGPLNAQLITLNDAGASFHPDTNPADIPATAANLEAIVALGTTEIAALSALDVPASIAAEHAADVTRHGDSLALLSEAAAKLRAGDVTGGLALANSTEPLSRLEEGFENKYGLSGCP